jgi:hypothetical protein
MPWEGRHYRGVTEAYWHLLLTRFVLDESGDSDVESVVQTARSARVQCR